MNKLLSAIVGIILLISIVYNFYNNSSSNILGRDESLYIFLAKGHNSNTPLYAPPGSWLDAIEQGVKRTTDPPGFFLLLHFWEKVSFNEIWLRLLPLIFYLISIVTLIKIALLLRFSLLLSLCLGFLPLASERMVFHSLEIRAYGMEVCLTYLMIFFGLKIIVKINELRSPNLKDWIILTLVMVVGLSSRFSFVISSISIFTVLWLVIVFNKKQPFFKTNFISLGISSILSLVFFAVYFRMKPYLGTNSAIDSVSNRFFDYTTPEGFINIFSFFIKQITLIPIALLGGSGIKDTYFYYIVIILIVGFTYIGIASVYHCKKNINLLNLKTNLILYLGLFLYPLIAIFLSGFLAISGIHPFSLDSRYSMYLQPSLHVFIMGCVLLISPQTGNHHQNKSCFVNKYHYLSFTLIPVFIVLIYGLHYLFYQWTFRMGGAQHTTQVINKMIKDHELKEINYWYISLGEIESFKYHVLYGGLKGKLSSQAKIIFENRPVTVNEVTCSELETIFNEAEVNNKIVMLLGHVNKKEAELYWKIFEQYFSNVKYGEFEISSEQIGIAIR